MNISLAVHQVHPGQAETRLEMMTLLGQAVAERASIVVFSEMAFTGWTHSGRDPDTDRAIAVSVHHRSVREFREAARRFGLWVAFGFLETAPSGLYDSAVLIGPDGRLHLHYRRLSATWRWPDSPPIYREGQDLPVALTPFGRVGILLCGDVCSPAVLDQARTAALDMVLVPFSRGFDEDAPEESAWSDAEPQIYADALAGVAPWALCVNHLGMGAVGGAFALNRRRVVARLPIGRPGVMTLAVPGCSGCGTGPE